MDKKFAKYMRYGKQVKTVPDGETFKLIEDMDANKDTVRAVPMCNLSRYELLQAWSKNRVGVTEEERNEMQGYESELPIDGIVPNNVVRFITSGYNTLFEVPDLSFVKVNGELRQVVYIDDYHFSFAGESLIAWGGCLHICQFAELCEKNRIEVEPAE